jgi:hypothetical protein
MNIVRKKTVIKGGFGMNQKHCEGGPCEHTKEMDAQEGFNPAMTTTLLNLKTSRNGNPAVVPKKWTVC